MFVIRSIAQAKSQRRDEAVGIMKEMVAEAGKALGWPATRISTGSVGVPDSTIVMETEVESLAQFEKLLDAMNSWSGMQKYGPKFAEFGIDGTHRFEIFRVR